MTQTLGWPDARTQPSPGVGWPGDPADAPPPADDGAVSRETSPWGLLDVPTAAELARASAAQTESLPIAQAAAATVQARRLLRDELPRPAQPRVLVVANQKGGVGKTTTAVNVAAGLALHGLRVLLVDMDPQGNASTALGLPHHAGEPSTYDVLVDGLPLHEAVRPCPDVPGLLGVPATIDLAGADIELVGRDGRETLLRHALAAYLRDYPVDYVLLDCPPTLGLLTVNALVAGLEVLIPIQCEYYALEGLTQLLATIDLVRQGLNPHLVVSTVLLTMFDARTRLAGQVADEVRAHFGDTVLPTVVPRSVRLSEAPGFGQTVHTYAPGSPGAMSYLQAARDIAHAAETTKESA
jgi:chromosome partitioning protein